MLFEVRVEIAPGKFKYVCLKNDEFVLSDNCDFMFCENEMSEILAVYFRQGYKRIQVSMSDQEVT